MRYWKSISLAIAIAIFFTAFKLKFFISLGEPDSRVAAGIFAQIAATMLGFLIAAISIIASISSNKFIKELKKSGHYDNLLRTLFFCSSAYAVAMITSLGALMTKLCFPWPPLISLATFSFATLLLIDVGRKLWLVLNNLSTSE